MALRRRIIGFGTTQPLNDSLALCRQRFRRRSESGQATFAQQGDLGAGGIRICCVVRDQHGLHAVLAQPALQSRKQCIAGCAVEGGKWFVKQKQARMRRERTRQRYPLRFAAGKIRADDDVPRLFASTNSSISSTRECACRDARRASP